VIVTTLKQQESQWLNRASVSPLGYLGWRRHQLTVAGFCVGSVHSGGWGRRLALGRPSMPVDSFVQQLFGHWILDAVAHT